MTDQLIIKKYPNRRLYDTSTSRYITLDDVRALVIAHKNFKVVDARSDEDMTSYVLLQIITEEEAGKFPLFTTELLQSIIRYYGSPMQKSITQFLEKSMTMFNKQFTPAATPLNTMADTVRQSMELWQNSMTDIFQNIQKGANSEPENAHKKKARNHKSK